MIAAPAAQRHDPVAAVWQATAAIAATGQSLMARVLGGHDPVPAWDHFPPGDVVNGPLAARYFYHCHNPGDRPAAEHGHFHLFVGKAALPRRVRALARPPHGTRPRPALVHVAALSFDGNGVPRGWFAPNRWVTNEWLYPASAITALLPRLSFAGAQGDALVNQWLTALVAASAPVIAAMLARRDAALIAHDPTGEDRARSVLAELDLDLDAL